MIFSNRGAVAVLARNKDMMVFGGFAAPGILCFSRRWDETESYAQVGGDRDERIEAEAKPGAAKGTRSSGRAV
jgi:hypothetical protein